MVLLGLGVTLVSKNGIEASAAGFSTVNCMLGSCVLMCCSKCWLCSAYWMTRVSSINLTYRCGGCGADWRALQTLPWRGWLWGSWWWNPWLYHEPVHNIYPGRGSMCFWGRTPVAWQLRYGHLDPLWQCGVQWESLFDYIYCRVY